MCNMTSSSRLPQCEHQSLSSMVLSGTGNQVFVNVHSDTFRISNKFQVTKNGLSYSIDINWNQ